MVVASDCGVSSGNREFGDQTRRRPSRRGAPGARIVELAAYPATDAAGPCRESRLGSVPRNAGNAPTREHHPQRRGLGRRRQGLTSIRVPTQASKWGGILGGRLRAGRAGYSRTTARTHATSTERLTLPLAISELETAHPVSRPEALVTPTLQWVPPEGADRFGRSGTSAPRSLDSSAARSWCAPAFRSVSAKSRGIRGRQIVVSAACATTQRLPGGFQGVSSWAPPPRLAPWSTTVGVFDGAQTASRARAALAHGAGPCE